MNGSEELWSKRRKEILGTLGVSPQEGLSSSEARRREKKYGLNVLKRARKRSAWDILGYQLKSVIALLLAAAALLSFILEEWVEGSAIVAVLVINTVIGFFTEVRATRSMEALRQLGAARAKVRRDGKVRELPASSLVPGDIVVVEGGDVVGADLRLLEASKLQADESSLTGESIPVNKTAQQKRERPEASLLFRGTAVTRGSGVGVVIATGMDTEIGKISALVEEAEEEITPLEKRLDHLGHRLVWVTLVIAVFVAGSGIIGGRDFYLMVETAVALAVATIPEGLPIVATVALARGMWRMARRNALVNRLSAVETLGAANVICTDKTGTLTENRLTLVESALHSGRVGLEESLNPAEEEHLSELLKVGVLCNNAHLEEERAVGEPLEVALLLGASRKGIHREELLMELPELREEAFDPEVNMMATVHQKDGQNLVAVKGAPEAVLSSSVSVLTPQGEKPLTGEIRQEWKRKNLDMAEEGLRVIALARKYSSHVDEEPYRNLVFLGLAGLLDPPRRDVQRAIEQCAGAGIKVVMVTGDHPLTAKKVASEVGLWGEDVRLGEELEKVESLSEEERSSLLDTNIFARVNPRQKLGLVKLHQEAGSIVGMTGDGVNDAPALKKADIGIAMGMRGTQVAREAADMVLKDDAFSTIAVAIEQGRIIFNNIRKFVLYLLSCNLSEIFVVSIAAIANAPLPILPLQILFLNLVTDVFPALALGAGEGEPVIMKRPPRDPEEPVLTGRHWLSIGAYGLAITLAVLASFALAFIWLGAGNSIAVTVSFLTLAFAQLWHVFNMREGGSRVIKNEITGNPFVWGALAFCIALLLLAVYLPGLSTVLQLEALSSRAWGLVLGMSLLPLIVGQAAKSASDIF